MQTTKISPQGEFFDGFVTYNLTTVVTLFIIAIEENRFRLLCWNLLHYKNSVAWYFGVKKKTWIKQFFILQISPMPLWKCSTKRDAYYAIEPGLRKDIYLLLFVLMYRTNDKNNSASRIVFFLFQMRPTRRHYTCVFKGTTLSLQRC